jgi:hypothetical protein
MVKPFGESILFYPKAYTASKSHYQVLGILFPSYGGFFKNKNEDLAAGVPA